MKLFTIGFTKKSAREFFTRIKNAGARKLVDTRLNNISQLSGFAKRDDLKYFLGEICHIPYEHIIELAPTQDILDEYKKGQETWSNYEQKFRELITKRHIELLDRSRLDGACLLCSEDRPHHCHRRLVAEYLKEKWDDVEIEHL